MRSDIHCPSAFSPLCFICLCVSGGVLMCFVGLCVQDFFLLNFVLNNLLQIATQMWRSAQ